MSRTVDQPSDSHPPKTEPTGRQRYRDSSGRQRYRDSSGRALTDYTRPSVAVDAALLTLVSSDVGMQLSVLQVRRPEGRGWSLPGTFLHEGERLSDAVLRCLRDKAGVTSVRPRQLHVFDDPHRDNRGWVLSVAHVDAGPLGGLNSRRLDVTRLAAVSKPGTLPYGHRDIVELAVRDLQRRYLALPDPAGFLSPEFTLKELRDVHQAVAGEPLQRDTFRRSMEDALRPTGRVNKPTRGRPAELFMRV